MMSGNCKPIVVALLLVGGLSACDRPGPAEKAGRQMDRAASETGSQIGKTIDKVDQALVERGNKTVQAIDDSEITARVKAAIFAEPGLKTLQISVDTIDGVVTLSGSVDAQDSRNKARSLAAAVDGVKEVINKLRLTSNK